MWGPPAAAGRAAGRYFSWTRDAAVRRCAERLSGPAACIAGKRQRVRGSPSGCSRASPRGARSSRTGSRPKFHVAPHPLAACVAADGNGACANAAAHAGMVRWRHFKHGERAFSLLFKRVAIRGRSARAPRKRIAKDQGFIRLRWTKLCAAACAPSKSDFRPGRSVLLIARCTRPSECRSAHGGYRRGGCTRNRMKERPLAQPRDVRTIAPGRRSRVRNRRAGTAGSHRRPAAAGGSRRTRSRSASASFRAAPGRRSSSRS